MEDISQRLLDAGFHFVSFRPRSEREMRNFLGKKLTKWSQFDKNIIDQMLDKLKNYGYIDDTKFVVWWVGQRNAHRPKGVRVLASELRSRGIAAELIKELLTESAPAVAATSENQLEAARKVVAKFAPRLKHYPKLTQRLRLFAALLRRGFSSSLVRRVVDEAYEKDYNETVD